MSNEIILDGHVLRQDKECDGSILPVKMTIDLDFDKDGIDVIEYRDCSYYGLQYDDRHSNYALKYCEGSIYFCNESDL